MMKVRIYYDNGIDYGELEYFSRYNRINAKGIKGEAKQELVNRLGYQVASNYKIIDLTRI